METKSKIRMLLAVMVSVALVAACSSGPSISADAMPDGKTYSGLWYSNQFEQMYLHQEGDRVRGVYTGGGGGEIEGQVEGNLLLYTWSQPGDRQAAQPSMDGEGYFHLVVQGGEPELVGEWGYDEPTGTVWEAEWVRERKDHDPRDLEELEARR